MKSDGTNKTRVAYEPEVGEIRNPSWSLENKIFHYRFSPNFNSSEIYVMDHSGNDTIRLTFNNYTDRYPKYSTQNILAFFSNTDSGEPSQLWILELSNSRYKKLTTRGIADEIFSWSPDGDKIVYTQHNYSKWNYNNGVLWVIDINTGTEKQLTYNFSK